MFDRVSGQRRTRTTREATFPAPVKGWVQSGNITTAARDQAEYLDNFFPTAQSVRLRGGTILYADIGSAIVRLMTYSSGTDKLFAGTASGIYDCDRINAGGAAFADVAGLASGDWSSTQIGTAGGQYAVFVNGANHMHYYDGTAFYPLYTQAVNNVGYDALAASFAVGQTVTGGTSGATAVILSIVQTSATAGTLRVGTISGGPFQDNEALTTTSGAATANGASSAATLTSTFTGVTTASLSQVWLYKKRLFFVESASQSVWYLPVDSIGGAATEINLGSIFRRGGQMLFGATWSLDSGSGLDDVCVFVTTNGEIAVYEGTDPSSASTWALIGVYDIATPLNKHAWFKAGGDLAILTDDGIIPVSEALKKDRAALQAVAISYPIEDAWKSAVADALTSFPIAPTLWQAQSMLVIGTPNNVAFVANARTGAWCRFTGWDVRCGAVANNSMYFGDNAGSVFQGDAGGTDDGTQYTGLYVPKFSDCGTPALKSANHTGLTFRASGTPNFRMACHADYAVDVPATPSAGALPSGSTWGTAVWGSFTWGSSAATETYTLWEGVGANGFALAPSVQVTSNQTEATVFEILAARLRFEGAGSF
jgi:hypothetical protein